MIKNIFSICAALSIFSFYFERTLADELFLDAADETTSKPFFKYTGTRESDRIRSEIDTQQNHELYHLQKIINII